VLIVDVSYVTRIEKWHQILVPSQQEPEPLKLSNSQWSVESVQMWESWDCCHVSIWCVPPV